MFDKKIDFCATNKEMLDIWPHPTPATQAIPKEYKNLERLGGGELTNATVKTCMPFLDAMTAGYVLYFDQDYLIDPAGNDFQIKPSDNESHMEYHGKRQLPKEWHGKIGENAGKINNVWLIKTPPGYSCLFVHPLNHMGIDKIEMISGIVDTDVYTNTINFPFVVLDKSKQFLLKKGDPMIQVIPFKRESWKMSSGFYYEKDHSKTRNLIRSEWLDKYKRFFWNKKSYK
jgi:hypothetical protein